MTSASSPGRKRLALRTLRVIVAAAFILFGILKLVGIPMMVAVFDRVGLGQWFRYATGLIEVGGAVLLLSPRYVGASAVILTATCIGAVIAHLTVVPGPPVPAAILLVLSAMIAWVYRDRTAALVGRNTARQVAA